MWKGFKSSDFDLEVDKIVNSIKDKKYHGVSGEMYIDSNGDVIKSIDIKSVRNMEFVNLSAFKSNKLKNEND